MNEKPVQVEEKKIEQKTPEIKVAKIESPEPKQPKEEK